MKAVIPVAGAGTMLRPHTHTQPKALVPVAGKPLLAHIVDFLLSAGVVDELIFVIGHMGHKIQLFMEEQYKDHGLKMHFVRQEPREGSAHAVLMARPFIEDDERILIMFGDTIVSCDLNMFLVPGTNVVGVKKVDRPSNFGIAEIDKNAKVTRLIEKPRIPKSNMALVGVYKIEKAGLLFDAIESLISGGRGINDEYHLTDALMRLLQQGEDIYTIEVDGWYDCGKKETLLEANSILLNRPSAMSTPDLHFPESIIIHPVRVGKGCHISHSIIGPNVVIGENSHIENTILTNSIVGAYSHLQSVILHASILGNDTVLKGVSQSLNIGDNTEINLG